MNPDKKSQKSFITRLEDVFRNRAPDIVYPPESEPEPGEKVIADLSGSVLIQSIHALAWETFRKETAEGRLCQTSNLYENLAASTYETARDLMAEAIRREHPSVCLLFDHQKIRLCKNWKLVAKGEIDKTPLFPDAEHPVNRFFEMFGEIMRGDNKWSIEKPPRDFLPMNQFEKTVGRLRNPTARRMYILAKGIELARHQVIPAHSKTRQWWKDKTYREIEFYSKQMGLINHLLELAISIFRNYLTEEFPQIATGPIKTIYVRENWIITEEPVKIEETVTVKLPPGWNTQRFLRAIQGIFAHGDGEEWKYDE